MSDMQGEQYGKSGNPDWQQADDIDLDPDAIPEGDAVGGPMDRPERPERPEFDLTDTSGPDPDLDVDPDLEDA